MDRDEGSTGSQEGSCVADVTHGAICGSGEQRLMPGEGQLGAHF